jgi:hypothetical protein
MMPTGRSLEAAHVSLLLLLLLLLHALQVVNNLMLACEGAYVVLLVVSVHAVSAHVSLLLQNLQVYSQVFNTSV